MKSKTVALLLALFLGGLGIHKFYLGSKKTGWLYLLFFWTVIPAILALIDFFVILFMPRNIFNRKYSGEFMEMRNEIEALKAQRAE